MGSRVGSTRTLSLPNRLLQVAASLYSGGGGPFLQLRYADYEDLMTDPIAALNENMGDVRRLLEIHEGEAGSTRGRKFDVEVLNKSGVVLALACWEAYVEDCALAAFDFILANAGNGKAIAEPVRRFVARQVRDDKNDLAPWSLADAGWKSVMQAYRASVVKKYVSPLNTPSASNVDALFFELIGLADVSSSWTRHKLTAASARARLQDLISLRGDIAHRTKTIRAVLKKDVSDAADLVGTLASITSNKTRQHVFDLAGSYPWEAQPEPPKPGRKSTATSEQFPPAA